MYPQPSTAERPPGPFDHTSEVRGGLQYCAHLAPPASGRGLRHRRHSHQGTGHLRRWPRISHQGRGDFRYPHGGSGCQPGTLRGAGGNNTQGVQPGLLLPPGQTLHHPPRVPYRTYELEEITLVPRPITRPVEIWQAIVSGNRRGLDFMARNQIKGILHWSDETGDQLVRMYQEACAARGQELQLGESLCLGFFVHLDDSREKAMRAATPFFEEYMKFFAPLGFIRGITDEQMRRFQTRLAASTPGLPTIRTGTDQHSWLCGTPEDVIAQLKEFEARYPGLDSVIVRSSIGTPKTTMIEQLDWFAKEVIPAFRC